MKAELYERAGWKNVLFDGVNAGFLLFLMATMILPFLNVLALSLSSNMASMQPDIILFPRDFPGQGIRPSGPRWICGSRSGTIRW